MNEAIRATSFITAILSAGLWFWSALLKPAYPMAYASGPPKEVVDRMNLQARLNACAAALTGVTVLLQSFSR